MAKKPKRGGVRPGAGRKPTGKEPTRSIRVSDAEWAAWTAAAERAGVSRSEWIRGACNARVRG